MAERIAASNVNKYVQDKYGEIQNKISNEILGLCALLQNDFEGQNDCTLISATEITRFYSVHYYPEKVVYDTVKTVAIKYGYAGWHGTFSITVNKIVNKINQMYNIPKKSKSGYLKGIGYSIKTIMDNINNKIPMILNMSNDGRGYYKNHSVTVVGYNDYTVKGKHIYMLRIHDNWTNQDSFIDYQKLCLISSLNYCK